MSKSCILAYDAECGACTRFKSLVEFLDGRRCIGFVSLREAEANGELDSIGPAARYASFHLLRKGKKAVSGDDAVLPLARALLPGGTQFPDAIERVPVLRAFVSFGYSAVSRLHGLPSCERRQ